MAGCGEAMVHPTGQSPGAAPTALQTRALAQFNRGGALMEQYRYAEASKAYEAVLDLAPAWVAARFNLGVAYFNMHGQRGGQENLDAARQVFETILASAPGHLHARFCLGLYHQHVGDDEKALEHFQRVRQADATDPHAAYKCAEALVALGRNEEGTTMLEHVIALDPGFVSAVYRLALQYQRTGQRDKAMPLFDRFKGLSAEELTGGSFVVQKTYGTAGKYYAVLEADNLPLPSAGAVSGPRIVFSPEPRPLAARSLPWKWTRGSVGLPGVAVGDVDGDGDLDLCLTASGEGGTTSVWLNNGSGGFSAGGVVAVRGVSPCLGDVDNDGDLDLWLGCAGPDALLENDGKGGFTRSSAAAVEGPDLLTACARLLDVDSDGDLDLLAFRLKDGSVPAVGAVTPGASSLFNNNRDGSFADAAAKLGLVLADTPVAAAVYDDFDNDRDLDLVIFPADGSGAIAWVNDRVGSYRVFDAAATGLAARGTVSATSGDPDKDGRRDLLVFTREGSHLYVNRGGFRFEAHAGFAGGFGRLGGTGGQFADMDNDGDVDIVIGDARRRDGSRGPVLLVNDWPRDRFLDAAEVDPGHLLGAIRTEGNASCVAADFTGNGRCDVLLAPAGGPPLLVENVTPGGHWLALDLRGTREQDKKSRSNGSAIGARVEVKAGTTFQQFVVGVPSGPVAMPPLRVHAGLGLNPAVEWLRIVWPDAVLQAELELAADQVMTVTELPRKVSSCPCLFAWNGSRFEFVSDFGGVGGLGYFVAPGEYARPDPTEYLPIPQLEPHRGEYVLQVTEPLEEVVYFDEAKLIAVDHPQGTTVYPNEMMAIGADPPRFEVFCFERPIEPVRALDHRGVDVTDRLRRIDRRYAGATVLDRRFTGFAEDHFVELDFGDRLKGVAGDARLVLFLYGWVEYPYSSTNYAAAQAGLRTKAPSLHALRGGRWVELFREVGYPAGLLHMMTLDVTGKILPSDRRLRISTNMELYWDQIFLAVHLGEGRLSLKEAPARSADLHYLGYPREYSPDGHHPNIYDYHNVDTAAAWRLMAGGYTRYGDVTELLDAADDCYVIMGRGEEVTLRFAADAFGPVAEGRRRSFLLKTDGFCKDMDLYTAHPDTVEPLPFHAMGDYPYGPDRHYPDNATTRRYRRQFNTRRVRAP
ncbi:MAG: hypothetical protein AMS14_04150 [Planctomycetes bacterium DG_20]|nr:MAG: hypothetical protein AMS14_04150 [Planctomycetes bacterium DG_20]